MAAPLPVRRSIPAAAQVSRWQAPDGWVLRRFDWPADPGVRPRGALLFQGGRGDWFEKYLESFAHWQARGWNVTSLDWRGQGGSGRPAGHGIGHDEDFGGLVGDLEAFWADWSADAPGPQLAVGHSMGGHLLLRALLNGAVRPAGAVLVAPMLGLRFAGGAALGEAAARVMAQAMRWRGDPARPAWRGGERPGTRGLRQTLLTHDDARYADEQWWLQANPELRLGVPSWPWLAESFRSTRRQRADPRLDTLDVPVLMLVAEDDRLVDPAAAHAVARRLPHATLRSWGAEAAHELLREADPVRDAALAAIDAFADTVVDGVAP